MKKQKTVDIQTMIQEEVARAVKQNVSRVISKQNSLEDRIVKVQNSLSSFSGGLTKALHSNNKMTAMARHLVGLIDGTAIEAATEDAKTIHEMYALCLLKNCVMTEVAVLLRSSDIPVDEQHKILLAVTIAHDFEASWWNEREFYEMSAWVNEFQKLAKQPAVTSSSNFGSSLAALQEYAVQ